jgi:hypothetical protein
LLWTNLTASAIAQQITSRGHRVSVHIVEQLLDEHDYHRRKAQKSLPMKESVDRDQQFLTISHWTQEYLDAGEPILSMDSKKRELIGNFYRSGVLLTKQAIGVFDHDYSSFAEGVVIPHGLYDERLNRGYIHLGTSHDTSEFAGDCLLDWWERFGQQRYPQAKKLLLKCDGGGSNSVNTYLFKAEMQRLADATGLELRVAHYPSYCSKYNPIEHRLFCHLTRACQGVIFKSVTLVKRLMERTQTRTGLGVVVGIIDKVYQTGRKIAEEVKKTLRIVRDTILPRLNYRIVPRPS